MGKTLKIIVCGKKAIGKTSILEQLVYNNMTTGNSSTSSTTKASGENPSNNNNNKYMPTIEDIYIACWEKDRGVKEKLRLYDTKGMESSKDTDTIQQIRHLFPIVDGAVLVYSSHDADSILCVERLKSEIEKSKDKKEVCHFVMIDNGSIAAAASVAAASGSEPSSTVSSPSSSTNTTSTLSASSRESQRQELQTRLRCSAYDLPTLEKRDILCRPFVDLATNITQVNAKSSMNITIKKPKVFSSK